MKMRNVMIILQVVILLVLAGYVEADAKPIPYGVVIDGDLSVSIAKMERGPNTTTVWLAFRKLSEPVKTMDARKGQIRGPRGVKSHPSKELILRIIDNRGNRYEKYCYRENGVFTRWLNEPRDYKRLPAGLTWIFPVKISKIPEIAPISRIEIENRPNLREKFELNFRKPVFPNLDFEVKPGQILVPGKKIQINKNVSFFANDLMIKDFTRENEYGFYFYLSLEFKNADYNPRQTRNYYLAVQLKDGSLLYGSSYSGVRKIEALSTKERQIRMDISKDLLEKENAVPRMFFFYEITDQRTNLFRRLIPVSAELKQEYLEKRRLYLAQKNKKTDSQVASSQATNKQPEPKKQSKSKEKGKIEEVKEKAETVRSLYNIFK